MRRALVVASLAVAGALVGGTVAAAPPVVIRPSSAITEFVIPAGEACSFDVDFAVPSGKTGLILFESGRAIAISPGLVVTLRNPANGKSVTYNATGSFHDQPGVELDDGSFQFRTKLVGHNLVFGPLDTGAGIVGQMKMYVGRVTATVTIGTDGVAVLSDVDDRSARAVDVCAALS